MAALSRSVAVSMAQGPAAGLALADAIAAEGSLAAQPPAARDPGRHAGQAGAPQEAAAAYRTAIEQAGNEAERRLLQRKLADLPEPSQPRTTR